MKAFPGFPSTTRFAGIPRLFFTKLLAQIPDDAELRVTLYLFYALSAKKGYPRFVTRSQVIRDRYLLGRPFWDKGSVERALAQIRQRGIFLPHILEKDGLKEEVYLLNTEQDRRQLERIKRGEVSVEVAADTREVLPQKNIFVLYEETTGDTLTPMIAQELVEAEGRYPTNWIEDAFRAAAELNRRSWRYVSRILERWEREGRDGEAGRHPETAGDSKKHTTSDYGQLIEQ